MLIKNIGVAGIRQKNKGFSLVELLVVIAIIGVIATVVLVALGSVRTKARDTKRKADLAQVGRFLSAGSCFMPNAGAGEYDTAVLIEELKIRYPQYATYASYAPVDPRLGTASESFYRYSVSDDGKKCVLFANLENAEESVTLSSINEPTPGAGSGVLETFSAGWNGSNKYYQVSN